MDRAGITSRLFPPLRQPGDVVGPVSELPGAVPLIAVASHDTASAVAAVPATGQDFAYISSGTWSLAGMELPAPVLRRAVISVQELSGRHVDVVHIVGGGSRNELLCQLTADALGLPVVAGPAEATTLGNVLVQARALNAAPGSLPDMRALVRSAVPLRRFTPRMP